MPDGDEGDVNKWIPSSSQVNKENGEQVEPQDEIVGLEAALIYKERERQNPKISNRVRRFMGTSQDDEMWLDGVEAMKAWNLNEENGDNLGLLL